MIRVVGTKWKEDKDDSVAMSVPTSLYRIVDAMLIAGGVWVAATFAISAAHGLGERLWLRDDGSWIYFWLCFF